MSYRKLEIWQLARELTIEIHKMTFTRSKFEQFEEAQQIRRSSKTVRSCIVEGYGRRIYKADFIKFLIYSLSSMMKRQIILKHFLKLNRLKMKHFITHYI